MDGVKGERLAQITKIPLWIVGEVPVETPRLQTGGKTVTNRSVGDVMQLDYGSSPVRKSMVVLSYGNVRLLNIPVWSSHSELNSLKCKPIKSYINFKLNKHMFWMIGHKTAHPTSTGTSLYFWVVFLFCSVLLL